MDGRALTALELSLAAGVTPQTASSAVYPCRALAGAAPPLLSSIGFTDRFGRVRVIERFQKGDHQGPLEIDVDAAARLFGCRTVSPAKTGT